MFSKGVEGPSGRLISRTSAGGRSAIVPATIKNASSKNTTFIKVIVGSEALRRKGFILAKHL
ncbi:MAG: hypothetical protein CML60_08630 [Rhodobacteraceae bacterium]|nr:hypothetical protein [Paracoccaceae bacterium]MBT26446.1 hypothetical protein [Paracoccaceae bacterium]